MNLHIAGIPTVGAEVGHGLGELCHGRTAKAEVDTSKVFLDFSA